MALQRTLLEPSIQSLTKSPSPKHLFPAPLRPCRPATRQPRSACRPLAMTAQLEAGGGVPLLEVLVYCGEGAGFQSARNTLRALQRCLALGVEARLLGTSELLEGDWQARCLLLVMPGGADLPYCKHLNGRGNQLLRGYVAAGGSYLGICAGAYYACGRVEFEPGSSLEVVGERELGFFPGTARGAAYPGFDYLTELGACAAPLRFRPLPPSIQPPLPPPPPPSAHHWNNDPVRAARGSRPPQDEAPSPDPAPAASTTHGVNGGCGAGSGGGERLAERSMTSEADHEAAAAAPPPRLGLHHLELRQAGEPPRHLEQLDVVLVRHGPKDGCGDGSTDTDGDAVVGRHLTHGSADPVVEQPDASGVHDGWVYCRDYSNGGPVFVLEGPAIATATPGAAAIVAVATASSSSSGDGDQAGGGDSGGGGGGPASSQSYAVHGVVEVLAVYPELGDEMAAVRCRVGEGVAVLCGTHPEMPAEALAGAVHTYDGQQQVSHVAALGGELAVWEQQRRQLWAALLMACCTAPPPAAAAAQAAGRDGRSRPGVEEVEEGQLVGVVAAAAVART